MQCFALTAYMPMCLHVHLRASLHAYMLTRLHAYTLTCMCVHVCTLTCMAPLTPDQTQTPCARPISPPLALNPWKPVETAQPFVQVSLVELFTGFHGLRAWGTDWTPTTLDALEWLFSTGISAPGYENSVTRASKTWVT